MDVATLLLFTKEVGGSDLHLSAGAAPMVRVHGEMRKLTSPEGAEVPPIPADQVRTLILDVLTDAQKSRIESEKELDFAMVICDARFRGNVFFQDRELSGVFRAIPTGIRSGEQLAL